MCVCVRAFEACLRSVQLRGDVAVFNVTWRTESLAYDLVSVLWNEISTYGIIIEIGSLLTYGDRFRLHDISLRTELAVRAFVRT